MGERLKLAKKHAIAVIVDTGLYSQELINSRGITPSRMVKLLGIRYENEKYVKGAGCERALLNWHNTGSLVYYGAPRQEDPNLQAVKDARLLRSGANLVARNARAAMRSKPINGDEFYASPQWREVRYMILRLSEGKCNCCGKNPHAHSIILHVDHIKPRSTYPKLALRLDNLQVLCEDCNMGKSNTDETDFRPEILKMAVSAIMGAPKVSSAHIRK